MTPEAKKKMTEPRIIHVMCPEISQDLGDIKQVVRMCIEVTKGEVDFTGNYFKAVPLQSYAELQEKLKCADLRIEKLRAALEFYGDVNHWINGDTFNFIDYPDQEHFNSEDREDHTDYYAGGKTARAALKADEEAGE